MRKSLIACLLVISLIFSFASIGLANEVQYVANILAKFEGDWYNFPGSYMLSVEPMEEREDRFSIQLHLPSVPDRERIFLGQVEMIEADQGIFTYTFNPEEEASYTGGTIKFNKEQNLEIRYIDKDNQAHTIIFFKHEKREGTKK